MKVTYRKHQIYWQGRKTIKFQEQPIENQLRLAVYSFLFIGSLMLAGLLYVGLFYTETGQ